jgi:hypothetical protein
MVITLFVSAFLVDCLPLHKAGEQWIAFLIFAFFIMAIYDYVSDSDEHTLTLKGFIILLAGRIIQVVVFAAGAAIGYLAIYWGAILTGDIPEQTLCLAFAALGGIGALVLFVSFVGWLEPVLIERQAKQLANQLRRQSEELRRAFVEKARSQPFGPHNPNPDTEQIAWWVLNHVRLVANHTGEEREHAISTLCRLFEPLVKPYLDCPAERISERLPSFNTEEFRGFVQSVTQEINNDLFSSYGFDPLWLFPLDSVYGLVQLKDKDSWPVSILTSDWRTAIRMRLADVLNQHRHLVKKCERCFERFVTANTEETFCSKCSDTIRKKEEEERGQMRTAQPYETKLARIFKRLSVRFKDSPQ